MQQNVHKYEHGGCWGVGGRDLGGVLRVGGGSSPAAENSRLKEVQMFLRKARAAPHPLHQHREQHKDAASARTHARTRTCAPKVAFQG